MPLTRVSELSSLVTQFPKLIQAMTVGGFPTPFLWSTCSSNCGCQGKKKQNWITASEDPRSTLAYLPQMAYSRAIQAAVQLGSRGRRNDHQLAQVPRFYSQCDQRKIR